jgi:hypothetical protein
MVFAQDFLLAGSYYLNELYQCLAKGAGISKGLTPSHIAYSVPVPDQTARHNHSAICPMTSPNSKSTADQISADTKLAI